VTAYVKESCRKICTALVHLWIAGTYCEKDDTGKANTLPETTMFYVYPDDLCWGKKILGKSRIRVELTLEKEPYYQ